MPLSIMSSSLLFPNAHSTWKLSYIDPEPGLPKLLRTFLSLHKNAFWNCFLEERSFCGRITGHKSREHRNIIQRRMIKTQSCQTSPTALFWLRWGLATGDPCLHGTGPEQEYLPVTYTSHHLGPGDWSSRKLLELYCWSKNPLTWDHRVQIACE